MKIIKPVVLIVLMLSGSILSSGQSGVSLNTGIYNVQFEHESGLYHMGHHFGLDIVADDDTYFIQPGIHLFRIDLIGQPNLEYKKPYSRRERIKGFKVPLTIGRRFIKSKMIDLKIYAGGVGTFITDIDENNAGIIVDNFNDIHIGILAGVGLRFTMFTFDVFYEWGLMDALRKTTKSREYTLGISAGIFL